MEKHEGLDYSDTCSEIIKESKDVQLAPGLNTSFDCLIESIQLYQDNIVELLLQFRLQSYPGQLPDKYTFYSKQSHVIKDTYGAFYLDPWNDETIELFTHIYIEGHKKCTKRSLTNSADVFTKITWWPIINCSQKRYILQSSGSKVIKYETTFYTNNAINFNPCCVWAIVYY